MMPALQQSFKTIKDDIGKLQQQHVLFIQDVEKRMHALQEHQEHKLQQKLREYEKTFDLALQETRDNLEATKVEYILKKDEQQKTADQTYVQQAEIKKLKQTIKKLVDEREFLATEIGEFQQEFLQSLMELNTYTNNEIKKIRKDVRELVSECTAVFAMGEQLSELKAIKGELQPLLQHNIAEQQFVLQQQVALLQQQVAILQERETSMLPVENIQKHIIALSTKVNNLKEELEIKTNGFSHEKCSV